MRPDLHSVGSRGVGGLDRTVLIGIARYMKVLHLWFCAAWGGPMGLRVRRATEEF